MSETLQTSTHESATPTPAPPGPTAAGELGWRRLQNVAALVAILSFLIPMVLDGQLEMFLVAMAAPFIVGLFLSGWLPRTGAIFLGLVSLAIVLASAPFLAQALVHPEALVDFVSTMLLTLSCIIGAVATIPAYREAAQGRDRGGRARSVAIAAGAVAVIATGISVVSASRVQDVQAQPGDTTVRAEDFAFSPATIEATAGTVAVHVTNADSTRHTFTIDGIVDLSIAPDSTDRITFEAPAGTYRFYCIPHEPGMAGQLAVR